MKKLVMLFAAGAFLVSCGGSAADIDVNSLETACECAEAAVDVLNEAKELYEYGVENGEDMEESEQEEMAKDMSNLESKYAELLDKMRELGPSEGEECVETGNTMADLAKEMDDHLFLSFPALLPG